MENNLAIELTNSIEKKEKKRAEKKNFEVNGIPLEFRKLSQAEQREYYGKFTEALTSGGAEDMIDICTSVIYECCPSLQDPELHRINGVTDPIDIVRKLLNVREIDILGGKLFDWMEFLGGDEVAEKN